MDNVRNDPFLLAFFESVHGCEFANLGTETFTRTFGESSDTDVSPEPASDITESPPLAVRRRAAAIGTETHTLQRTEDPDDDHPQGGNSLWQGSIL